MPSIETWGAASGERVPLLGAFNIANVLAATAAGLGLGLPRAAVQEALRTFNPDDQYMLRAGDVIVAMTSTEGRAEIERHLLDMI